MNPLGKEQDKVFEHLEKGNFIAPPGGDPKDEEDISEHRRAMPWLVTGTVLATLAPVVLENWDLVAFLGTLALAVGLLRLWNASIWFRAAMCCTTLQFVTLSLRLVAQTPIHWLLESEIYPALKIAALLLGTALPWLLTAAFGKLIPKALPFMGAAAVLAAVGTVLQLAGGALPAVRIGLALLGLAACVCVQVIGSK